MIDVILHDLIMDLRQIGIEHHETLEATQGCIDKVYAIKRATDHQEQPRKPLKSIRPLYNRCGQIDMAIKV